MIYTLKRGEACFYNLTYTRGTSNKEYNIIVININNVSRAFTLWGRIGNTNQIREVIRRQAYDKLQQKIDKGYSLKTECKLSAAQGIYLIGQKLKSKQAPIVHELNTALSMVETLEDSKETRENILNIM